MIPQDVLDRIRDATDIVEVVARYVALKPAGRTFKGLCPFHQEKTPSFVVNPDKQFFHCFGCGAGGDVFKFLMRMDGAGFMDVVRQLAEKARIALPDQASVADEAQDRERKRLFEAMAWAAARFQQALAGKAGARAREYLARRGVAPEMTGRFGLGYAPAGWDNLLKAGRRDHFSAELLEKAGLALSRDNAPGERYDRFRDRLMFPIRDLQGRIVAFGGRILGQGEPKYLNSPETTLFKKGELLYALDLARDGIRKHDRLILVEGYMDVIACHSAGAAETVATLGTALTAGQAQLIRRMTRNLLLVYDADEAGIKAARRGLEILVRQDLTVKTVTLQGAKDPDEFIRSHGPAAWEKRLAESRSVVESILDFEAGRQDLKSLEGRLALIRAMAPVIHLYQGMERQEYLWQLTERVHQGKALGKSEQQMIHAELERLGGKPKEAAAAEARPAAPAPADAGATEERLLLSTLLLFPAVLGSHHELHDGGWLAQARHQQLLDAMLAAAPAEGDEDEHWLAGFIGGLADPGLQALATDLASQPAETGDPEAVLRDCLNRIKKNRLSEELGEIQKRIAMVQEAGDMETFKQLAQRKIELANQLQKLGIVWKREKP